MMMQLNLSEDRTRWETELSSGWTIALYLATGECGCCRDGAAQLLVSRDGKIADWVWDHRDFGLDSNTLSAAADLRGTWEAAAELPAGWAASGAAAYTTKPRRYSARVTIGPGGIVGVHGWSTEVAPDIPWVVRYLERRSAELAWREGGGS